MLGLPSALPDPPPCACSLVAHPPRASLSFLGFARPRFLSAGSLGRAFCAASFCSRRLLRRLSASSLLGALGVPLRCLSRAARVAGCLRRWVLPLPLLPPPFSICICTQLPLVYAPCSAVCTFVNPCACASLGCAPLPAVAPCRKVVRQWVSAHCDP